MTKFNDKDIVPYLKLLNAVEMGSTEDEWLEGYEAGLSEESIEVNPYPQACAAHNNWNNGWWDGFYCEEPLFDMLDEETEKTHQISAKESTKEPISIRRFESFSLKESSFEKRFGKVFFQLLLTGFVTAVAYDIAA